MNGYRPLALILFTLTGCTRDKVAEADASAAPIASAVVAPVAHEAGAVPWAAVPNATAATLANMSLPERFEAEKTSRPAGLAPNAEAVFAALEKSGLAFADRKQHLASPFGARYCMGARVVEGAATMLQISVCEYASAELAKMGRDYSDATMRAAIPNRTVLANKQVTLTTRLEAKAPENDAAAAKATAAFGKL